MLEKEIQKVIIEYLQYLENLGQLYFFRSGAGAMKLDSGYYFKTGKKGVQDITVICGSKYIALEVKTDKGVQSIAQLNTQRKIEKAGGFYYIVRSQEEVEKIINQAR